jgi:crossover junction endodeoxyribonuclease RuvC
VILSAVNAPLPERLAHIRLTISGLIDAHRTQTMAIEELYFTKFAVSIAGTAQARGVILVTAAERHLPIVEYNPRAVKMATTGFGSASKIQIQLMIQRHFYLKEIPKPDDAADALAIALCHLQTNHQLKVPSSRKSRAAFEADMAARAGIIL